MVDNMAELVYRKMGAKIRYYRQLTKQILLLRCLFLPNI